MSQVDPAVGLSDAEVEQRIHDGLTNDAPDPKSRSYRSIIRENTLTSFNLVIGTMWALMFIAHAPFQDSLFGFIIVINAAIGIIQEVRAKRTLERLSVLGEARSTVRRAGRELEVSPKDVVLDDVVVLRTGDQIVVDGVVRQTKGMEVDESLLTGEADPVVKQPGDSVMSGSFVVAGDGSMQATKVGVDSYATQLTAAARTFSITHSELISSIMKFVRTISILLIPLGILLFISQMRSAPGWQQALSGTVAGVVTMVPEGLVLLTSVAMAVAVVRLGQRRTLVQQMPAVEVLARVDVVCVDKTGTLTEPGMAVNELVPLVPGLPAAAALGALGASESNPNPTLAAIAAEYSDPGWTATTVMPFSSTRKWSGATFASHGTWLLGAPEVLSPPSADAVLRQARVLAATGARVLLLARVVAGTAPDAVVAPDADAQASAAELGLIACSRLSLPAGRVEPVALVTIDQRLRSDAAATVSYFLEQGVQLKVISGDNPATVAAISIEAGIPGGGRPFDARNLPSDPAELADVLDEYSVFGRVTPDQKRMMVSALQRHGHTVAMTGDGVNDVLALKDADLGIAMGSGAAATRAVAQLVLLDSKFAVLPHVVAEGRRVLGNIERVSDLFLTKSFYATLLSLLTVILTLTNIYKVEFIFLPRHLTVITFLTIGTPALFMALMPNTQRFRPGFFRRVLWFAIPAGAICALASFSTYLLVLLEEQPLADARTAAAITLFVVAWTVLLLVARPLNRLRLVIVIVMGLGFGVVLSVPWLADYFALYIGIHGDGITGLIVGAIGAAVMIGVRGVLDRRRNAAPIGADAYRAEEK